MHSYRISIVFDNLLLFIPLLPISISYVNLSRTVSVNCPNCSATEAFLKFEF
jgi:hypothetical protein